MDTAVEAWKISKAIDQQNRLSNIIDNLDIGLTLAIDNEMKEYKIYFKDVLDKLNKLNDEYMRVIGNHDSTIYDYRVINKYDSKKMFEYISNYISFREMLIDMDVKTNSNSIYGILKEAESTDKFKEVLSHNVRITSTLLPFYDDIMKELSGDKNKYNVFILNIDRVELCIIYILRMLEANKDHIKLVVNILDIVSIKDDIISFNLFIRREDVVDDLIDIDKNNKKVVSIEKYNKADKEL